MPRSAAAQEEPEVSTPITLSDDVGGEVSLTLGLDPGATDGFDDAFGEERLPPFPPEPSSLVARFIDDDLNDGDGLEGFPNSGMPADIRQGSSSFTGTKVHEIRFETGDDATEITIEWDLPDGVTGTIEDKFGGDVYGPASMEGSGSLTISPGDPEAILTIEYEENQAPTIDTNAGLGVEEGGRASITTSELSASDPDNGASELTYQLTSGPSQGKLLVGGSQASSFTQADLESGDVEYNHTASSAGDDSFEFDLTDPSGGGADRPDLSGVGQRPACSRDCAFRSRGRGGGLFRPTTRRGQDVSRSRRGRAELFGLFGPRACSHSGGAGKHNACA